jgi:hypothetical protein
VKQLVGKMTINGMRRGHDDDSMILLPKENVAVILIRLDTANLVANLQGQCWQC